MMKLSYKKGFTLIELLVVIAIIGILSGIVLTSLNSARGKANDAKVKGQLSSMRSAMETYYANAGNYGPAATTDGCIATPTALPWSDTASGLFNLSSDASYPTGTAVVCQTQGNGWLAEGRLGGGTGNFYCVDSSGAAKENATTMISSTSDVTC